MSKLHHCIECDKSFASRQSLWNHKQRCFRLKKQEDSTVQSKDKIIGDILNKVDQRVKDSSSVKKPELKMDDMEVDPKLDLLLEKKTSDPESKSESDSEETESSEESDHEITDEQEKLKEDFRNLYMKFHQDIGIFNKLVLTLDELEMMDCLTKDESDSVKEDLKKKIESSKEEEYMIDNPEDLKEAFRNLYNKFQHNIEIYNKLVFTLDKLKKINCLTKEECDALNENLQSKIAI